MEDDYYHLESAKRSEKLIYKKVSDRVLELLRGRELADCPSGTTIYDLVYGWESVFSTHANRTTIGGHLVKKERWLLGSLCGLKAAAAQRSNAGVSHMSSG